MAIAAVKGVRFITTDGLQRGHRRGASRSKSSIRVLWSHSPHQGGRAGRWSGRGRSAGLSRAASTAYGFRTPPVFAPTKVARACGVHPAFRAVATAGASLACWESGARGIGACTGFRER
jgi:hypothetical protein